MLDAKTILDKQWADGLLALSRAVTILKSQQAAADACGCRQSAISECIRNGQKVPAEWCIPLETATAAAGEMIPRAAFRDDLFGAGVQLPAPLRSGNSNESSSRSRHQELDARNSCRAGART